MRGEPVSGGEAERLERLRRRFPCDPGPAADACRAAAAAGETVAVAFSGGPDSLLLLLWWLAWFPEAADRAVALHFDHGTRGGASAGEAERARRIAGDLGIRFRAGGGGRGGDGLAEEALRRRRFAFLEAAMEEEGARLLLLGHQADDLAETFLARAASGAGAEGLAAPRPVSRHPGAGGHLRARPLLGVPAEAIRGFLREEGIAANDDASNRSPTHLRNRLRRAVLPSWKEALAGRDPLAGVARSRALLEETADFVESSVRRVLPGGWDSPSLPLARLRKLHRACLRFALQRWLAARGIDLAAPAVEEILGAIAAEPIGRGRWSAGRTGWLVLRERALLLEPPGRTVRWKGCHWAAGSALYLPGGGVLRAEWKALGASLRKRIAAGRIDPGRQAFLSVPAEGALALRADLRAPGDRMRPLGAPGERKLKDILGDRKIPLPERRRLPVVRIGEAIAWVPGLPPAEALRVRGDEERLLGLTYWYDGRD